jgi:hypothetical protein
MTVPQHDRDHVVTVGEDVRDDLDRFAHRTLDRKPPVIYPRPDVLDDDSSRQGLDQRLTRLDQRLSTLDLRLTTIDCRLTTVDSRLSTLDRHRSPLHVTASNAAAGSVPAVEATIFRRSGNGGFLIVRANNLAYGSMTILLGLNRWPCWGLYRPCTR